MSLLGIKNLRLKIHETEILKGVDLTVERGKIRGIIGESGSGKSMTAFATIGLLPDAAQTSGDISLDGSNLLSLSEAALCGIRGRDIGMIFQEPMTALNPLQSIGKQVAETILIHDKTISKRTAIECAEHALARCEMPSDKFPLSRFPFELSGGQRQRVVTAMAIALRPKLLIADEPTTALDVTTQAQILRMLKRLVVEDDMGLLMITHDLAVVSDFADDISIMRAGKIVEEGTGKQLFQTMKHPYTKALFAASIHQPARKNNALEAPLLEVKNVSRDYTLPRQNLLSPPAKLRAVNDVSFAVKSGESLGLVGESGCGKSTLTRAILGLDPVQEGEILLDGAPVFMGKSANRSVRRKMQVVFQDPYASFNPRHRVARLICEPFHLLETPPKGAARTLAINEALQRVGLAPEDQFKFIHEFSGGQRQRIAIARALIIKPDLIILDEAVSALDVSIRAQILDLIADLSARFGLSYLFISHDLSVVRSITDRVLVMEAGKIVEQGPTEAVFANPQHAFTKQLIAAIPQMPHSNAEGENA